MTPLFTAAEAMAADDSVRALGLPGICLMETASRAVARVVQEQIPHGRIGIACGPGQNGGDGFGAARWLHGWGRDVVLVVPKRPTTGDAVVMAGAAGHVPCVLDAASAGPVDGWVDALFGTGLKRPIGGAFAMLVDRMSQDGCPVVSVDLPSGLDANGAGTLGDHCVQAAHTVTMGGLKRGLAGPGYHRAGEITVVDIGWPMGASHSAAGVELLDVRWPVRAVDDYKTRSGHVAVLAGSEAYPGAAALACRGALRGGAGLVTLCTTQGAHARCHLPAEIMRGEPSATVGTVLVAGPGLDPALHAAGWHLWATDPRPMVADASLLQAGLPRGVGERVMTPHPGEARRLLGRDRGNPFDDALELARTYRSVVVLKGERTIVASPHGQLRVGLTGNPVLATGGSGDVLAGLIGAALARGMACDDAAVAAVVVHGAAGDALATRSTQGWGASDVADAVAMVLGGSPRRQ